MTQDDAEIVALQALGWLASDAGRLSALVSATGLDAAAINARAADPAFLAGVLDHLLQDDAHVAEFAATIGADPHLPAAARLALPGGTTPDWT